MTKGEVGVVIAVLTAIGACVGIHTHKKKGELTKIAGPFQDACRTEGGCLLAPGGWTKTRDAAGAEFFQKDNEASDLRYEATSASFTVTWHIGTDSWLYATGGKDRELKIVHSME